MAEASAHGCVGRNGSASQGLGNAGADRVLVPSPSWEIRMNVRSTLSQKANGMAVAMALCCLASASFAQTSPPVELAAQVNQVVQDMNRTAVQAAKLIGKPAVSQIACDSGFIVCTCSNTFDCAWLSWYCSVLGGVRGFDNECYLPGSVQGMTSVLSNAKRVASLAAARQ